MAFNFSALASIFEQVDSNIIGLFLIDGMKYEISAFNISFSQAVDHKGQPQYEVQGGHLVIVLTEIPSPSIYDWAKRSNKPKAGQILFSTSTRGTILDVRFDRGHCINITQNVNYERGTEVKLLISCAEIKMGEYEHNNHWTE